MPIADEDVTNLENRLDSLVRTQIDFQKEISAIRAELSRLRDQRSTPAVVSPPISDPIPRIVSSEYIPRQQERPERPSQPVRSIPPPSFGYSQPGRPTAAPNRVSAAFDGYVESAKGDFEKFIGENLISKIGIIVLVLGVGIGAKYAIDNNLISPLTRIIIGYVFGFGLVGLAIRLKAKYHNFSAVLISGGMAIMYFVTYFAHAAYGLIPQFAAFALMAMFTVFTVAAAFAYNRQVIAHIGLVGAYAVPFLLRSDSGNYVVLFAYITIVNCGILVISTKKNWTPIFYTAFIFTWAIFYGWYATKYDPQQNMSLALVFSAVFFGIFFATKIAQRKFQDLSDENARNENLVAALINGLVFFLFCFAFGSTISDQKSAWTFFSYFAIILTAVLVISFQFYRQWFVYLTFPIVWLTFGTWYADKYNGEEHLVLAAVFATIYFAIFYFTTLFHRLFGGTFGFVENTTAVLSNSFIYYGFGYSMLDSNPGLNGSLGIFTAAHSALHLAVAHLVNRLKKDAVDVIQVLTILVLTFATIAVPVQLNGNFVTLIWTVEAALFFWYGRTKRVELFEYFSYPIMGLASISLIGDWLVAYGERTAYPSEFNRIPLANGDLVTAMVFVTAFAFAWYVNRDDEFEPVLDTDLRNPIGWALGTAAVLVLFNALRIEIGNAHHLQIVNLSAAATGDVSLTIQGLTLLNAAWQMIYVLGFLTTLGSVNYIKGRSRSIALITVGFSLVALFCFCTFGMVLFSELRTTYFSSLIEPGGGIGWLAIGIRYVGYLAAASLLIVLYRITRDDDLAGTVSVESRSMLFEAAVYGTGLIVASCELVNVMAQLSIPDSTKLGLSILWGIYALMLVIIGIAKNRKHLRIGAFVLLGVTLAKLFLYDIADLDTIPKTILFITLGITLLIVSFLYNKYKNLILEQSLSGD